MHAGLSNGKIVNWINVDIERIGDFVASGRSTFSPSHFLHAAICSMVFVVVSNKSLVNMQEKHHSKIMEAKDVSMKATSETRARVLKLHSGEPTSLKKIL